jgi:photosystem II stability/assembly factor-like uncharacterized protein
MMNFKKLLLLLNISFILINGYSQEEGDFIGIEKQIENAAPRSQLKDNKGWKYEHRWLDEFKKRVAPNGDFYDGSVFYLEAEKIAAQKNKNNNAKMAGWVPVGPTQRASNISLTKGLGRINCITFHPTDPNTFWVGVAQGGVWKTTDSGQNWTPLTDDLPILRISDIAVDPNNTDIIYVCVGDYAYMDVALNLDDRKRHSHYGMGVYKTIDGGSTWNPTGLTYLLTQLDGSLMRRVLINPNNTDSIIAGGIDGVWASDDAGATWTQKSDSLIWDLEADPNDPFTLFATTGYLKNSQQGSAGIMKSTDFGQTWNVLNTGIPPTGTVLRIEVAVAPTNSNHIYALACNYDKGLHGIYSSLDGGINWSFSNAGGLNILEWYDGFNIGGQGTYDLSLLVDPTNENKIYTGGVNIWGSSDGGSTFDGVSLWYDFAGPGTGLHADQHQFKYNPLDNKFYVCNDGGLVRTSNIQIGSWNDANNIPGYQWPTVWEYVSDGMQTSSFYSVAVSEGNSGNFSAGAQDNSTYFNNGGNWSNLFGGDGMATMLHPTNGNVIFGSSQYGRILYSNNGGINYNQMNKPGNEDGEWVTPFMYEPSTTNIVYGGFGNLYKTSPGNDFTNSVSNFAIMSGASVPAPISHFNIAQSDPLTIYVAKRIYHSYNQQSELWLTTNGGTTWLDRTLGLPDSSYFTSIEVDNDNPLSAWVVVAGFEAGKHIYHTVNGGATWTNITYDLPNLPTNCIVHQDNSNYNTVYVGTDIGVYYSNDTLSSWLPYNTNLPNVIVSDLEIHYTDEKLYAATFGRGVWKTDVLTDSILNVKENGSTLQNTAFELYPNPNNGEFNLNIAAFEGDELTMEIIDVMGKVVVSEELPIYNNQYQSVLNYELANGMYFLKISHGKQMRSLRFIVQ